MHRGAWSRLEHGKDLRLIKLLKIGVDLRSPSTWSRAPRGALPRRALQATEADPFHSRGYPSGCQFHSR
jgi:hypothetical protein